MKRSLVRIAIAVALATPCVGAQATDSGELTRDLLRVHNSATGHEMAFWVPAGAMPIISPDLPPSAARAIDAALAGYQIFLVARMATPGPGAAPVDVATGLVRLRLADGRTLEEVPSAQLPPTLLKVAHIVRDKMAQDGRASKLSVIVFNPGVASPLRIDGGAPSILTLLVNDVPLTWHLPLAGAGPASVDAESGEKFPGSFAFNPYTGQPLKHE